MRLTEALHINRRRRPRARALACGPVEMDWATLTDRIARLASVLAEAGLEPGGRVAILLPNGAAFVEILYAALWAGGVGVPLNWRLQPADVVEQLAGSQPTVLLCAPGWHDRLREQLHTIAALRRVIVVGASPEAATGPLTLPDCDAMADRAPLPDRSSGGDSLAFIFYTGGTTGAAKGVMLSHANVWSNSVANIAALQLTSDLVHLHTGPLFHVGTANRMFTTTIVGGTHVVLERFDPAAALAAIRQQRVTLAAFVPTMLAMILDAGLPPPDDLASLRLISYGASPMPPSLLVRLLDALPGVAFAQTYGMTELSPVATMLTPADHAGTDAASRRRLASAGKPVFTADIRIVDEHDVDRPTGTPGEIVVRGPMVMLGYWGNPALTDTILRGGWMHTGDVGFLDEDGYLFVTDRIKDMIISGGENVYSLEVENVILGLDGVKACAVVGLPDATWGERVHAAVVGRPDGCPSAEAVREHCRARLAGYKVPKSVTVTADPLPLTGAGKVDKAALRRMGAQ